MRWVAGNGLTLKELEQLEEAAHHSPNDRSEIRVATCGRLEGSAPVERVRLVYPVEGITRGPIRKSALWARTIDCEVRRCQD